MQRAEFTKIDGAWAFVRRGNGAYQYADVYARETRLYIRVGSDFFRLEGGKDTSNKRVQISKVSWGNAPVTQFNKFSAPRLPDV